MKDTLIEILETFCPNNVYLQGTVSEVYPESFITFWTDEVPETDFLDDEPSAALWNFSVNYYSADPANVNTIPAQIKTALKAAGFIPEGKGRDLPSDRPTHTGWTMDFIARENY